MVRDENGLDDNHLLEGENVLWENDQWRVTNFVLEEQPGGSGYWIARDDLSRPGWVRHMAQKNWVDVEVFKEAYVKACEFAGIEPPGDPDRFHPAAVSQPGDEVR